jgi:hypothetical protein
MRAKSVTLAFKHWFSEAGFSELTVSIFSVLEITFMRFAVENSCLEKSKSVTLAFQR